MPWVQRGFRVIAPDMLGYGGTDKPQDSVEYSTKRLCADLSAILDLLDIPKAVLIGHDWGAFTVTRFALWHPDRILALVILSVPYTPPSPTYIPLKQVAKIASNLSYQAYFEEQRSTKEIESNLNTFLRVIYRGPNPKERFRISHFYKGPEVLSKVQVPDSDLVLNTEEFAFYDKLFQKGGMNGPLNYYRTALVRHEEELASSLPSSLSPSLPVLFIYGTKDTTTTTSLIGKARKFIPGINSLALEDIGHWVLVEEGSRKVVEEKVGRWLEDSLGFEVSIEKAKL